MGGLVPAPPSFKPIRAYVAQLMGHADATTTLRVYARLMQEGVRLDREETLRALYDAYGWSGATPVLPREEDAGMEDAKTRMNTGGPAWIRTRNQRLMRAFPGVTPSNIIELKSTRETENLRQMRLLGPSPVYPVSRARCIQPSARDVLLTHC